MRVIQKPKGTEDILPSVIHKWYFVEEQFKKICSEFGYSEMRTPMFESTELFRRGVGETTDIVQKEMFDLEQRSNPDGKKTESLTLKPEGTASVVRAYIENSLYSFPQPTKIFYITPCFRYEQPQKGRQRQFHQFGIEALSSKSAYTDAEVISLVVEFFNRLGIMDKIQLRINSVGTVESRKKYSDLLREFYQPNFDSLCDNCKDRFYKNPLRILDCKEDTCKKVSAGVPLIIDNLDEDSKNHFDELQKYLKAMDIPFTVDPFIVRGLDYYVKTAFEFVTDQIGSQSTVCGGGRYDGLVEQLGGPETPGIGFGLGIERLILLIENVEAYFPKTNKPDLFVVALGDQAKILTSKLVFDLRKKGIRCDNDHLDRSMKAQMKFANKLGAKYTAIIGENEIKEDSIILKNMDDSSQISVYISNFIDEFSKIINEEVYNG